MKRKVNDFILQSDCFLEKIGENDRKEGINSCERQVRLCFSGPTAQINGRIVANIEAAVYPLNFCIASDK